MTDASPHPTDANAPATDDYRLRPAAPADAEAMVDVHVAAIRDLGAAAYDPEQVDAWAANKRPDRYPLDDEDVVAVVAESGTSSDEARDSADARIVGFGWVDLAEADVTAVYVHPDHARAGVGTAVLERLEAGAREAGLDELTLLASANAVAFYERRGYEGLERVDHETRGVVLECTAMRTRLEATGPSSADSDG